MNIFERNRIKKSLRGCDYVLAASVIKEKIGKSNESNGHLHKLIEVLVSNPCLENALKLIEQDSMMFFYFNECKDGGLYRKQPSKPAQVHVTDSKKQPQNDGLTLVHARNTKFPNVISTLKYDCNEIEDQIKEFQRLLDEGVDMEKNRKLLEYYKEGLWEFKKAIDVLQKYSRSEQSEEILSIQPEMKKTL